MEFKSTTHYFCKKYKENSDLSLNTFWQRNCNELAVRLLIVCLADTIDFFCLASKIFMKLDTWTFFGSLNKNLKSKLQNNRFNMGTQIFLIFHKLADFYKTR